METTKKAEKVHFDYSLVGFAKTDDDNDCTLDGTSLIDGLTPDALRKAAVYGMYVVGCRSLAGHSADTLAEKKALITKATKWYVDGCPKREKAIKTAEEKAVDAAQAVITDCENELATLTPAEKKIMAGLIAKKKVALEELKAKATEAKATK